MAFDREDLSIVGSPAGTAPTIMSYETDDTRSQVMTDDYFLPIKFQLKTGDIINLHSSDGSDILVMSVNGTVVSTSELSLPLSTKVINAESDFPAASGGIITLEDDKHYVIGADISTANRFVLGANNVITSGSDFGPTLTYTGTGDMFTGVDVNFGIEKIRLNAATCNQVFNISATVSHSVSARSVTILNAPKVATFTGMDIVVVTLLDCVNTSSGITIAGAGGTILELVKILFITGSNTFIGIDLGTAQYFASEVSAFICFGVSGSIGIAGATASANVTPGSVGLIANCEFVAPITPLSGLTVSDIRWKYIDNSNVPNSAKVADAYLTASRTVTIATQSVFVTINGTNWSSDISERFSVTTAGVQTYTAEIDEIVKITGTATVSKVGGGSNIIEMRIAINGTTVAKTAGLTQNSSPTTITSQGLFTISQNDTVELMVANNSGTSDIIVAEANLITINGL